MVHSFFQVGVRFFEAAPVGVAIKGTKEGNCPFFGSLF